MDRKVLRYFQSLHPLYDWHDCFVTNHCPLDYLIQTPTYTSEIEVDGLLVRSMLSPTIYKLEDGDEDYWMRMIQTWGL